MFSVILISKFLILNSQFNRELSMSNVKAIVLRAAGINCDLETQNAFELAGAAADRVHINRIIEDKSLLDGYQILVVPGGFSYGDDVAAGKILANQIKHHLYEQVRKFIDAGKLVLGICNGFQVLVKAGILPGDGQQSLTITYNDSNKYEDRWVYLAPQTDRCVFIEKGRQIYLPVAHGEGKIVTKDQPTLEKLKSGGFVAFKYVDENGNEGGYPVNPKRLDGLNRRADRFYRTSPRPYASPGKTRQTYSTSPMDRDEARGTSREKMPTV